jgi:membrane protease YdiL (CAAX protease family)
MNSNMPHRTLVVCSKIAALFSVAFLIIVFANNVFWGPSWLSLLSVMALCLAILTGLLIDSKLQETRRRRNVYSPGFKYIFITLLASEILSLFAWSVVVRFSGNPFHGSVSKAVPLVYGACLAQFLWRRREVK